MILVELGEGPLGVSVQLDDLNLLGIFNFPFSIFIFIFILITIFFKPFPLIRWSYSML